MPALSEIKLADFSTELEAACNHYFTYLGVLDLAQLKEIAAGFIQCSPGVTTLGDANLRPPGFPLDRLGLLFAVLAFAYYKHRDLAVFSGLINLSISLIDSYAGGSTLELASALMIQHICALRTDAINESRALLKRAIDAAHNLSLQDPTHNTSTKLLRFYLTVCFADQ